MGSLYAKDLVDLALSEIGYQADGKYNKYAEELDSIDYFNMGPKNGSADFCAIFICWLAYRCSKPDPSKWDARYFLFQPGSGEDLAASCGWGAQYYMDNDSVRKGVEHRYNRAVDWHTQYLRDFILNHPHSFSSMIAFYQICNHHRFFDEKENADLLRMLTDSLEVRYPDSQYVRYLQSRIR